MKMNLNEVFLAALEGRHRFIEKSFCRIAIQLEEQKSDSKHPSLSLPELQAIKQCLTQKEMESICNSIHQNIISDIDGVQKYNYCMIEFENGSQNWDEQVFSYGNAALEISIKMGLSEYFNLYKDTRVGVTIYLRLEDRQASAFLKVKSDDSIEHFFELEGFCMLYNILESDMADENDNADNGERMFIIFNKTRNLYLIENLKSVPSLSVG